MRVTLFSRLMMEDILAYHYPDALSTETSFHHLLVVSRETLIDLDLWVRRSPIQAQNLAIRPNVEVRDF